MLKVVRTMKTVTMEDAEEGKRQTLLGSWASRPVFGRSRNGHRWSQISPNLRPPLEIPENFEDGRGGESHVHKTSQG